jgi:hypothetical protein
LHQRPLVLGKDAWHLEQHPFFRTGPQAVLHKDHRAAAAGELLDQEHLRGIAAGEAIGHRHQQHLQGACCGQIPQAVERGAIEARPTDTFINKHARRRNVIARGGGRLVEEGDLAGDGLFAFLFFGGDPRRQGRAFQALLARCRGRGCGWGRAGGTGCLDG